MNKIFKTAFIWGIILCIILLAVNIYVTTHSKQYIYDFCNPDLLPNDADCIIVLGAGLKKDGTPNHMLQDRLDVALELYNAGICKKMLLTGDHGTETYDEVNAMKKYVIDNGVDIECVYLDHAGFSTYDSIYRAKNIFGVKKAIVVTQKYHLYRAVYIANKIGINISGMNSDKRSYIGQEAREIRETLARLKDYFSVIFNVKPKYMGEKIDINSSSALTTHD